MHTSCTCPARRRRGAREAVVARLSWSLPPASSEPCRTKPLARAKVRANALFSKLSTVGSAPPLHNPSATPLGPCSLLALDRLLKSGDELDLLLGRQVRHGRREHRPDRVVRVANERRVVPVGGESGRQRPSLPRRPRPKMREVPLTRTRTCPSGTGNPSCRSCRRDPGSSRRNPCERTREGGRRRREGQFLPLSLLSGLATQRLRREWTRDALDVERALEARGKEAAERCDERRKRGEHDGVQLERRPRDRRRLAAELWTVSEGWTREEGREGGRGEGEVSSRDDPDRRPTTTQKRRGRTTGSSMAVTDCGRARSRQTKTLLGSHVVDEKADVDRSWTGQIM